MSAWRQRGVLAWTLSPLALAYAAIVTLRRVAYASGILKVSRVTAPVVVLGNLYVGGTGKTPLAIALVRALRQRGFRPGVVSRGYGGAERSARVVSTGDTAAEVGDEPLLIAESTGVPVAVGARRAQAAALLLQAQPTCDVLIADDGLQHLALGRDLEIALIDERGLGNGWVLPAGPLREPPARLARVDAMVLHGAGRAPLQDVPCFSMRTRLADHAYRLADRSQSERLADLVSRQRSAGLRITAAAGIGVPRRFFDMLTSIGLQIDLLPLPDHFDYRVDPFAGRGADLVLITEKDAVKCRRSEAVRDDERLWVVPLEAQVDAALVDLVVSRLNLLRKTPHGSPAH
jgi:tetraacyldisaccharide 4'-kinase